MDDTTGLWKYIQERERIRKRRLSGKGWPWTQDPILQTGKFTNVQREHDRTSKEFASVYRGHTDSAPGWLFLYNCAVARWFGTAEFYTSLGWQSGYSPLRLKDHAVTRMAAGKPVFTRAYVVTNGGRSMPKPEYVADVVLHEVWWASKSVASVIDETRSWRQGAQVLSRCEGHGGTGFMAKEVLLDYIQFMPALVDWDTWTPVGPGALRGLGRLLVQDPYAKMKDPLGAILALLPGLQKKWAKESPLARKLSAHDVQFCLCEYDKYERVRLGEGKMKNQYVRSDT